MFREWGVKGRLGRIEVLFWEEQWRAENNDYAYQKSEIRNKKAPETWINIAGVKPRVGRVGVWCGEDHRYCILEAWNTQLITRFKHQLYVIIDEI